MADWQLGPTVPAGRLVVGNNCPSWQTGSQNQQYQLADCQPGPTFPAGSICFSWSLIWELRSHLRPSFSLQAGRGPVTPAGRHILSAGTTGLHLGDTWSQAETWSFILGQRQSQSNSWDQSSSWRSKAGAGQVDYGG
ncbi:hypothetical protein PCANC_01683 [Puccinia coronata f. sp. avenae]|uniref:Uncharacterized protein n=1 Tax=Puccinia coronata f. sp. avenae TaxID=200324 RepID=A0A2N5W3E6_9BASI|nr:hypothetical protein PCANC_01683 [Puccinia coronata f. sp. avenae]